MEHGVRLDIVFLLLSCFRVNGWGFSSCDCDSFASMQKELAVLRAEVGRAREDAARARADGLKADAEASVLRQELASLKVRQDYCESQKDNRGLGGSLIPWSAEGKMQMFAGMPMPETEVLGQIFLGMKVSEIVMNSTVGKLFNFDTSAQQRTSALASTATLVLSVPTSPEEVSSATLRPATAALLGARIQRWGVAALQAMVPASQCDELAAHIMRGVLKPTFSFGSVNAKERRKDYPLDIDEDTVPVFEHVLKTSGPVLKDILGADAILVEFSSLTTFPGSEEQPSHPDAAMHAKSDLEWAKVLTVFVHMTNVEEDRAALDVMPGTHGHFHFLMAGEVEMLHSAPFVRMAMPKGSFVIMDSRTYHRGGSNNANRTRSVFYFSFMSKGPRPDGPTYSIRGKYRDSITLQDAMLGRTLEKAKELEKAQSAEELAKVAEAVAEANAEVREDGLETLHANSLSEL